MKCHACGAQPVGICRFCGRAVCEACYTPMPYILNLYVGEGEMPKAVVVTDVLWCGTCKLQPEPIPMPEMF